MKKILSLLLFPLVSHAAVEFDLRKGVDMTATNYRPASLYNQLVDNGTIGATNKGAVIRQATTPDYVNNPRYTNFLFISNSVVGSPTLMMWNGSGYIPAIVGANTISASNLQDSAVTAGKLAGSSVFGTNIVGNTIQGTNIADGAISGDKIANNGIWQGKFINNAIRGIDITNRTIWNTNLVLGSLTSNEMASASIATPNLSDGAVTTDKIATTNVTRDKILGEAISSAQMTNGAVASNNIASLVINPIHLSTNIPLTIAWGVYTNDGATATLLRGINATVAYGGAAGLVTVTFVTAPADVNYGVIASGVSRAAQNNVVVVTNKTATSFQLRTLAPTSGTGWDNNQATFQVLY